jgi:hypothetical protein
MAGKVFVPGFRHPNSRNCEKTGIEGRVVARGKLAVNFAASSSAVACAEETRG